MAVILLVIYVRGSGCSARVYKGGVYGFASGAEYSKESIQTVLKAAHENAMFMDSRVGKTSRNTGDRIRQYRFEA